MSLALIKFGFSLLNGGSCMKSTSFHLNPPLATHSLSMNHLLITELITSSNDTWLYYFSFFLLHLILFFEVSINYRSLL